MVFLFNAVVNVKLGAPRFYGVQLERMVRLDAGMSRLDPFVLLSAKILALASLITCSFFPADYHLILLPDFQGPP